jgi:hypothetical protein
VMKPYSSYLMDTNTAMDIKYISKFKIKSVLNEYKFPTDIDFVIDMK